MAKRLDPAPSKITVVNDTVATLLAGKAIEKGVRYSAYLGFILGTGTNVAYIEKNENITKLKDAPAGAMAINTESGGFNKIAQSKFDEAMDKKTADCGNQRFEKMISGAYLGRIGLEVFKAAAREGFFSEDASPCSSSARSRATTSTTSARCTTTAGRTRSSRCSPRRPTPPWRAASRRPSSSARRSSPPSTSPRSSSRPAAAPTATRP